MFVVRIIVDDEETDWKVFDRMPDAERRFWGAVALGERDEIEDVALYSVRASDAREAKAAVECADKERIELIHYELSRSRRMQKIIESVEFEL